MKYIVELSIPKLLEVEAKSEDEAIRIVRQQTKVSSRHKSC